MFVVDSNGLNDAVCNFMGTQLMPISTAEQYSELVDLCTSKINTNADCQIGATFDKVTNKSINNYPFNNITFYDDGWADGWPQTNDASKDIQLIFASPFIKTADNNKILVNHHEPTASSEAVCKGDVTQLRVLDDESRYIAAIGFGKTWTFEQANQYCSDELGNNWEAFKPDFGKTKQENDQTKTVLNAIKIMNAFGFGSTFKPNLPKVGNSYDTNHTAFHFIDDDLKNADIPSILIVCFNTAKATTKGCKKPTTDECLNLLGKTDEPTGYGWPIVGGCLIGITVLFLVFKRVQASKDEKSARERAGDVWGDEQFAHDDPWAK